MGGKKKNTLPDPSKDINLEANMKELCTRFCVVTNYKQNQIINPRNQVFKDKMLCHWVSGSQHCKGTTFL
jgi:hypothetical protein